MSLIRRSARGFATIAGPTIRMLGADRAIQGITGYGHALVGQGAGSGWDHCAEIATVARLVDEPHPVIFDVGANNGLWSSNLAYALKRPSARFHLFEVAPTILPFIRLRLGEIPNPTLVEKAVSDEVGTIAFHAPEAGIGAGLGSVHARRDVGVPETRYELVEVPTITLDCYAQEVGASRIDLLKMDIEGHELHALRGAAGLLRSHAVKVLTFEFGSANVNSRTFFRDFWDLLTGYGYRIERIVPGGGTLPIRRYTEDLEYFRGATNYVALVALGGRCIAGNEDPCRRRSRINPC
jgi:FkbM family methyltransferase